LETDTQYREVIWILISLCTGGVRHLYYNSNCYTVQTKLLCVSQGSTATSFRWVRRVYMFWCEIYSELCKRKIIKIGSLFAVLFKL